MANFAPSCILILALVACSADGVTSVSLPRKLLQALPALPKINCALPQNKLLCKIPIGANVFYGGGLATAVPTGTGGTNTNSQNQVFNFPIGLTPPVVNFAQSGAGNLGTLPGLGLGGNAGAGIQITTLGGENKVLNANTALAATLGATNTASGASGQTTAGGTDGVAVAAGGGPNLYVVNNLPLIGGTWGVGTQGVALGPLDRLRPRPAPKATP